MGHLVALVGQSVQLGTNKASTKNLNPLSFDQFCRLGGIALNFSILAPCTSGSLQFNGILR
jgi:hypothetical protein